jgi:hypothetical protein
LVTVVSFCSGLIVPCVGSGSKCPARLLNSRGGVRYHHLQDSGPSHLAERSQCLTLNPRRGKGSRNHGCCTYGIALEALVDTRHIIHSLLHASPQGIGAGEAPGRGLWLWLGLGLAPAPGVPSSARISKTPATLFLLFPASGETKAVCRDRGRESLAIEIEARASNQ